MTDNPEPWQQGHRDDEPQRWPGWLRFLILTWLATLAWGLVALAFAIFRSPT